MTLHSSSPDTTAAGRFRELMAAWPTGVAVVTGTIGGRPVGCTVTAVASVSTNPPLLLVSLAAASRTLRAIERTGRFGVCVLPTHERRLALAFATGEPSARFAGVGFDRVLDIPVLSGTVAAAVCAVRGRLPVADHVLVTGEPLWQAVDHSGDPIVWFRRDTWGLSPVDPPG